MPTATINGLSLAYEVVGDSGQPWVITPGGRFTKESPGVRQLAEALAEQGNKVLIWDRPNCGASDVCFEGSSESAMQADALAGLLTHLDMTPAVIAGGSGGARVSLLTAARHPETAAGLAIWWISGGVYGLISLATHYCGGSVQAAWTHGMEAVADLPEWAEVQRVLPLIEEKLAPFNAKPHWAKVFTMPPARLHQVYANTPQFQALLKQYDPQGKFRNQFLDTNIFGA